MYSLYGAGAKNIYYDLEGSNKLEPVKAYVELPEEPEARAACIQIVVTYCKQYGVAFDPADFKDRKQRYIEFAFGP